MLNNGKGQNAIEYVLLFVIIILVIVVALAPGGFMSSSVDQSINGAITGIEGILDNTW